MEAHSKQHRVHEAIMTAIDFEITINGDQYTDHKNKVLKNVLKMRKEIINDYKTESNPENKKTLGEMFVRLNHDICLVLGIII